MTTPLTEDRAAEALWGINEAISVLHSHLIDSDIREVAALADAADHVLRRLEQAVSRVSGVPIP